MYLETEVKESNNFFSKNIFYNLVSSIIFILLLYPTVSPAQSSIKGNITTLVGIPNFGYETNLGEKTTFQVDAMASFWTKDGIPYKFGVLIPEFRYYPRESGYGFFVSVLHIQKVYLNTLH